MALYLTILMSMLHQIGLRGSRMLIALYALHLGAGPFAIGVVVSMYAVFPLVLAVYAGRLTDRIGVRWPMVLGSFGMVLGLLIPTIFLSMPALYVSAAVLGASNIFFHVSCHNMVGALGDGHARINNFTTFSLGAAIAGMVGPILTGFTIDVAGYSATYYLLAGIVVLPGIFLLCYSRFIPANVVTKRATKVGAVRDLLASPTMRGTLITSGLILTGIDLFNFYMPIYGQSIGLEASVIGVISGTMAAAAFVVRLWMPWMAKRYGEERVLTWSLLAAGATYFLFPIFQNPVILAAISFLLGLGLGCGQPLSIILTYNCSPPGRSGEALGMRLAVNKFTQIVVPLTFGTLGTAFGIYPIFWSSAVLLLLGGYLNANGSAALTRKP